jgi:hypothetical protein
LLLFQIERLLDLGEKRGDGKPNKKCDEESKPGKKIGEALKWEKQTRKRGRHFKDVP